MDGTEALPFAPSLNMSERHDHFIRSYAIDGKWRSISAVFKLLYSDFVVIEIPEEAGKPLVPLGGEACSGGVVKPDPPPVSSSAGEFESRSLASDALDASLVEKIERVA